MVLKVPHGWIKRLLAFGISLWLVVQPTESGTAQVTRTFSTTQLQAYQLTNLSPADESALGAAIDAQLQQEGLTLYTQNQHILDYVNRIAQRVAAASRWPGRPYTVQIVVADQANAFATVGGYIYIHTGLLTLIQNEAELAGVLAHEIGHLEEQDGLNQIWQTLTTQQLSAQRNTQQQQVIWSGGQLRALSNSHEDEYIADRLAFHTLARAGYSPQAMVDLLSRMAATDATSPRAGWISTHPDGQNRLRQLQQLLGDTPRMLVDAPTRLTTAGSDNSAYAAIMADL
jgi:predicted Zn-dependent protease